ncbi:MAG: hydantoinase/oxoprolinase family protein [Hyphomicrobiaceae bacterium]|nr:hydantoinase/oxoprolinase family protein [Hyphomicrobiaceae bacterium]
MLRVSVDIGGTFTDMVVTDRDGSVSMFKSPSTPGQLAQGVMDCLRKAAAERGTTLAELLEQVDCIIHGTTATTNALITRTGAKTAIITTEGFRDIIELRRGIRIGHSPYNLKVPFPKPIVSRDRVVGVAERVRFDGQVITPLDEAAVEAACRRFAGEDIEAVAVCFLFSYLNPAHERRAAEICRRVLPGAYVAASSDILPASREFERFNTTVVAAYGGPVFSSYIDRLEEDLRGFGFTGKLLLIQSNGGIEDKEAAKRNPVSTLLSGPAAGPAAGVFLGGGYSDNIISVDMGGTSFEVALIRNGETLLTTETWLSEQRLAVKMVDVHSIGAGGGSVAWFDPLGLLRVGPQSAGAVPGPACYGRGGSKATVTDANVALGYIAPDYFLGGEITLDAAAAEAAVARNVAERLGQDVAEAAFAIYDIVNESMADALNERCTKRGFDPREFLLISAGGAGGLHAATIAEKAKVRRVMIPRFASTYCAFGMQLPDYSHDYVRSYAARADAIDAAKANNLFAEMEAEGRAALAAVGVHPDRMQFVRSVDMRYVGQFHEVDVPAPARDLDEEAITELVAAFHAAHSARYHFSLPDRRSELLYLRLRAIGATPKIKLRTAEPAGMRQSLKGKRRAYFGRAHGWADIDVYDAAALPAGATIPGPALVEDPTTTILIPHAFACEVDRYGNFLMTHKQ